MFLRKFKKPISCFQIAVFLLVLFLFFLCVSLVFIIFDYHWNNKVAHGTNEKANKYQ